MIKFIKSLFKNEYLDNTVNGCANDKICTRYDHVHKTPVTYTPAQESIFNVDSAGNSLPVQMDCQGHLLVEGIEHWSTQLIEMSDIPMNSDSAYCGYFALQDGFLRLKDAKTGAIFLLRRES